MQIKELRLVPDKGGCFEVTAGGDLLYSKLATGVFPDEDRLVDAVGAKLG
jgi:selenoprotein W-related protein